MTSQQGQLTGYIGEQLEENIKKEEYASRVKIFYDHGNSARNNVCSPTTYMGRRYGNDATLSGVDIVVTVDKKVVLAIEVEEHSIRPKAVLGDIFGIAVADSIMIKNQSYPLDALEVIVVVPDYDKGKQTTKYERLERLLQKYFQANSDFSVGKVKIVTCDKDDMVRRTERLIRREIGQCIT
ncbi:MAG: hypothetical protein ACQEP7_05890 [bacterium]